MACLQNMIKKCGEQQSPGTLIDLYYTCSCELNGFPRTRKELNPDNAVMGDSKILDEPFDFSDAESGEGYWRRTKILVDTGEIKDTLEGEVGGQGYKNSFNFFIVGTDEERLEFADDLAKASGFMILMLPEVNNKHRVLGNTSRPAYVESAEGTSGTKIGDRKGFTYTCSAQTGKTAPIYDVDTHGIDITPNP